MTEVEQYTEPTPPEVPAVLPPNLTGGAISMIREYTAAMDDAHRFASAICQSPFVPSHFKNKPADTVLAILYGASVGFDPMTSVQQLFVIGGKPALYARAMVAVALAAGHEIWTEEESPGSVTVAGRRKGSDKVQRVTWTSELAKQAGYTSNSKYRSDPRSMLYARASGDVARRIAPDALLGLAFNVEEMQLVPQAQQTERAVASSQKDRVRAAIATTPQASGPADAGDEPAPETPPAAPSAGPGDTRTGGITKEQSKKLHALVGDLGLTREQKISGVCQIVGRQVESTNDLTKAEAIKVIDSLEQALPAKPAPAEPDEDGAYPAETVDEPDLWQQCIVRAGELGMNLWTLDEDFRAFTSIDRAEADDSALGAYLAELQQRSAA